MKLPVPAWPFNCAGSSPVPRAFTPSGERKGPKPKSWLLLFRSANATSPMFFSALNHFAARLPTQRTSKSVVPRVKHNEQTRSSGARKARRLRCLRRALSKPTIVKGESHRISADISDLTRESAQKFSPSLLVFSSGGGCVFEFWLAFHSHRF